jgi:hypothetical protein
VTQFGRTCTPTSNPELELELELDESQAEVCLAAPTPPEIARHLAGLGAVVDIELARLGAGLTARYART